MDSPPPDNPPQLFLKIPDSGTRSCSLSSTPGRVPARPPRSPAGRPPPGFTPSGSPNSAPGCSGAPGFGAFRRMTGTTASLTSSNSSASVCDVLYLPGSGARRAGLPRRFPPPPPSTGRGGRSLGAGRLSTAGRAVPQGSLPARRRRSPRETLRGTRGTVPPPPRLGGGRTALPSAGNSRGLPRPPPPSPPRRPGPSPTAPSAGAEGSPPRRRLSGGCPAESGRARGGQLRSPPRSVPQPPLPAGRRRSQPSEAPARQRRGSAAGLRQPFGSPPAPGGSAAPAAPSTAARGIAKGIEAALYL